MNQKDFDEAIKNSLEKSNCYSNVNEHYYNNLYSDELKKVLIETNQFEKFKKNEWNAPSYHEKNKDLIKMCSVASSSRLAFLYFLDQVKNNIVELEVECNNDLGGYNPQLDAFNKNKKTYYECKCHEICNKSHNKLKNKYIDKLKELFGIDEFEIIKDENEEYIELSLKELGCKCDSEELLDNSIYNLHLDVKQLICHLIGIQNKHKKDKEKFSLQYIFFKPNEEKKENEKFKDKIGELYHALLDEWEMIINSKAFNYFLENNNNIIINKPTFVDVGEIKDIVLERIKN